jgi:hypothetical protein
MSRLQLALNVSDLGTEPANLRPDSANFAIANTLLNLVLMENARARGHGMGGKLNHPGVEVKPTDEVVTATRRLSDEDLKTEIEYQTTCHLAMEDKVWVNHSTGAPWEAHTVLADAPAESSIARDGGCWFPAATRGVLAAAVGGLLESSTCG